MQTKADEHLHLEWTVFLEWPPGILSMGPVSSTSCGSDVDRQGSFALSR
ncbi:MAG TPA: hypothetical protein QF700_11600 [Prochlorococcus sp.]|nr:hypothetical protein [Prochlorococcus sp.]